MSEYVSDQRFEIPVGAAVVSGARMHSLLMVAAMLGCCVPALAAPALAQPAPAMTCINDATKFAGQIGTSVDAATTKAGETQLVAKDKVELRFVCPTGNQRSPRVQLSWREVYPPAAFWNVVADSGAALTGASTRRVRLAGHQAHKLALLAANKTAQIRQRGLGIECHVVGGVTTVTLRRRAQFPVNLPGVGAAEIAPSRRDFPCRQSGNCPRSEWEILWFAWDGPAASLAFAHHKRALGSENDGPTRVGS